MDEPILVELDAVAQGPLVGLREGKRRVHRCRPLGGSRQCSDPLPGPALLELDEIDPGRPGLQ